MASNDELSTDIQFEPGAHEGAHFELTIVRGPDPGRVLVLDETRPGRALIGQSNACDLRVSDRQVSRRHLAVEVRGDTLRLRDLESTNGTRINGLSVIEANLIGGEHITIGTTVVEVTRVSRAPEVEVPIVRSLGRIIGSSLEMRRLYPLIERLASSPAPVLIEGEAGTGKELVAETFHEHGPRSQGSFYVFDCTSVSEEHGSAVLNGNAKGTPATSQGIFDLAKGGTLVLDEIDALPLELQPQLLRILERGETQRQGENQATPIDVRVVTTTRQDLDRSVQEGRFRDDLLLRIAPARIELPPLRERRGDIGVLARHFWSQLGGASSAMPYEAFEALEHATYSGNVRELHAAVVRLFTVGEAADGHHENAENMRRTNLDAYCGGDLPFARAKETLLRDFERDYVEAIVKRHGGNVQRAATASGLALRYFQVLRARYRSG